MSADPIRAALHGLVRAFADMLRTSSPPGRAAATGAPADKAPRSAGAFHFNSPVHSSEIVDV